MSTAPSLAPPTAAAGPPASPGTTPTGPEAADGRGFVPATLDLGDLVLRPWSPGLAVRGGAVASLTAAAADPEIALWNPLRAADLVQARACLDRWAAGWENGSLGYFAILDAADAADTDAADADAAGAELLGTIALRWTDRADGLAMVGYWLLPAARGRGVATRATRAITRWGFESAGARRIELAHAVDNPASCRVAERCGFPLEGTLRESFRFGDGRHHDEHLHARLATDDVIADGTAGGGDADAGSGVRA
ncbi:GNAT family N-acetyltransferase [Kitasatospora sp. NPDC056184]|uniref:GNAT family N-acetyltransferase n=1 Tax=Kitasatospora sp. NPDC056184 TaxID=3345738 RepID=UPI0035DDCA2F